MAVGDLTIDSGFPRQVGNMWMVCGTLEAGTSKSAFAVCSEKSRIVAGVVVPSSDVQYVQVVYNKDASDDDKMGTISVDASANVTCYYTLYVV